MVSDDSHLQSLSEFYALDGSIYIMDRGYLDFQRLYNLHQSGGQFVIRSRKNLQFYRKSSTPSIEAAAFSAINLYLP